MFNEISPEQYTDSQCIQFLHAAVTGTSLAETLTSYTAAIRASGSTVVLTFPEFVGMVIEKAQVHDAARAPQRNPRANSRSTNVHDMTNAVIDNDPAVYAVNVHDIDTPIDELMVFNVNTGMTPRNNDSSNKLRVFMGNVTWSKLSVPDRKHWMNMSNDGKMLILKYGSLRESSKAPSGGAYKRQSNVHETEDSVLEFDESPSLEVSTHECTPTSTDDDASQAYQAALAITGYEANTTDISSS